MENFNIIFNGSTGSIGTFMPRSDFINSLKFRIENNFDDIYKEICTYNADALIHFAAMVNVDECEKNPSRCYKINVEGSEKVFKAAVKAKIKRFVYVSTSHVYSIKQNSLPLDVNAKTDPKSIYAKSKLLAENRLITLSNNYPDTKLSIARVFSVLSNLRRKGFLLTRIHEMAKTKKFEPIKGLKNVRDFLWANEVCKKILQLCHSKSFPPIVNICSGKAKNIESLVKEVFIKYGIDNSKILYDNSENEKNFLVGVPSKF